MPMLSWLVELKERISGILEGVRFSWTRSLRPNEEDSHTDLNSTDGLNLLAP